ncbi:MULTISPECIES: DUF1214 domain-containing protein [Mycolicibacterium]|uniref:Protein of uncharacterized function (DUF1214) n=1 Tax=Mycolicibacterium senegalense TaxID=1796 RepID=A0A378W4H9_9MYCO|nr:MULTISPECIES: DUF1214 domain-containing protein [Mycolicibacterium]MCV7334378.1 DUF1214 domain-containing protein [Mycolicibacterium senegalense]MDR7288372.1 hypothetical protein [Mycolicibacterium senegalense]QZA25322.1 DUF1214 domain-containing protein [Mycolicibacterium senegalense]CDP85664.1 hypothetical protein BN975_02409 [Mycolicibacterium farcinogenes]SUA28053.1 Protein of uncharacterised function (DUF1214) [Mycolicibacterium senegalense]
MTTTSATAGGARFIGRVGALAVALGIGVAVANGTAIASAQTGSSDSSGTSSGVGSSSKSDSTTPKRGPRKPSFSGHDKLAKRVSEVTAKVESALGGSKLSERRPSSASITSTERKPKGDKGGKDYTKPEAADTVDDAQQAVSRAITDATDGSRNRQATLDTRPQEPVETDKTEPLETLTAVTQTVVKDVVEHIIPASGPRIQAPAVQPIPEMVAAVTERLKPHLPETPVSPIQEIGLAALLGWSRRDGRQGLVPFGRVTTPEATSQVTSEVTAEATSILATEDQLAAEQQVSQIVNTPIVQLAKVVLMAAWYVEAAKNFSAVGGPDWTNLSQLNEAATEYANQSATEFILLNSNDPKLLLQVNPPHSWNGQDAGGTRIWYDNPDTVYRFTGINGASTYEIQGKIEGYDPADPSTHPTSANTNFSVLTGINGVTAQNLDGEQLSIRDDGTFTIVVSPNAAPENPEQGMNYIQAPANSTILATRNTLGDWNTETPMTLTIEKTAGPPSSLFSQIGGFAIPGIGETVVKNPALMNLVSIIPAFDQAPLLLSSTETALLMLVTGISGENTYMTVATGATGTPNTLSQPQHNAQFLSTQLQSAGYFQLKDDEAMIITVDPGDAEYFVVPVTNDWTITNDTRNQQTSLNNSQAVKNADGTYTIVVSKNDPGVANWVSTGGLNQGTISMRFQGVDPDATNMPTVSTQVVNVSEVKGILEGDPNTTDEQLNYDRAQQLAERKAGYDRRYTV